MPNNDTPISSFQDATEINSADKLTGLQNNVNRNFSFSSILAWFVNAVKSAFVPVNRTVNGKTLDTNITLTASDVGAQPVITASGILKGNGAGGVSAAVPGTDYGTYSKPSGGIPSSDMTSAVQTSLGKADSAYQKPSGGIPASDLANGVIPSVPSPSDSTPQALGTAAAGSSGNYSRADHVHQKPSAADIGAYVKPSGGIPSSDMASGVQTSLGKADTAYQKPSAGIPSSDMASAVQTSLGLADSAYQLPSGGIPASDLASGVIPTVPSAYTSNPAMDGTASSGTSNDYARGDHVHPPDSTKAAKSDLTSIQATGTTNTTGAAIPAGALFYLNGILYRAKEQIGTNILFTVNTNCEQATISNMAEYWLDVTSLFSPISDATLKVLANPATRKVKLFFLGNGLPNGSNAVTIPTQYAPDTSKLVYVSSSDSYRIGIFHGRFTQTPSSLSNIYEFHSFLRYYSGNRQIAVYYPLANPAYAVTFDIEYVY